MRYALVQGSVVVNVVVGEEGWRHPELLTVPDPDGMAEPGGTWDGKAFSLPASDNPGPPPVPSRITRRQARLALLKTGLLDAVEQIMTNPETPRAVRITYEDAAEWWRDDPMVTQFASDLELTSEQVDDLFRLAATL